MADELPPQGLPPQTLQPQRKSGEAGAAGFTQGPPPATQVPIPGPGNALNERTYQEVEYLKRNLGPILVAALAEICIRRPADPIEYLGHWLLRWRYNEELKRRDVQNALEVVRRKTWNDGKEQDMLPNPNAPEVAPAPEMFGEGFVPQHPYAAPGYGGPLNGEQLKSAADGGNGAPPPVPLMENGYPPDGLVPEEGGAYPGDEQPKRPSQSDPRQSAMPQDDQPRRPSQEQRRASQEQRRASQEQRRLSQEQQDPTRASQQVPEDVRASQQVPDGQAPKRPSDPTRASQAPQRASLDPTRQSTQVSDDTRASQAPKRASDPTRASQAPQRASLDPTRQSTQVSDPTRASQAPKRASDPTRASTQVADPTRASEMPRASAMPGAEGKRNSGDKKTSLNSQAGGPPV